MEIVIGKCGLKYTLKLNESYFNRLELICHYECVKEGRKWFI